jgi:hypothetical protein
VGKLDWQHEQGEIPRRRSGHGDTVRSHERIDERHVRAFIAWRCAGISIVGSQGEFFVLDESEHIKLLKLTADAWRAGYRSMPAAARSQQKSRYGWRKLRSRWARPCPHHYSLFRVAEPG